MTINYKAEQYLEFQAIARVLHNVLMRYPNFESIQSFKDSNLGGNWPQLANSKYYKEGKCLLSLYCRTWSSVKLNDLKLDYGQLFYGPGKPVAMPWGSIYLGEQQLLNDDSTLSLKRFYKKNEISFDLEYNQPSDHIALIYAALDRLLEQAAENMENENVLDIIKVLMLQHMLPWTSRCLELIIKHANTDFYKG
ncbi:molecular chaperone, partial [Shewanella sp. GutDb-MelDb]|uniref:TorD/DmsD family molecular chaperone n=1 Tax=Shewanella sp. GutDb-MelDb TaxID=2058316 RepID=UPI000C7C20DA